MRYFVDRFDVRRDVLAFVAIAACRRKNKPAMLVAQGARKPVNLRLSRHRQRRIARESEKTPDARDEFFNIGICENISERENRHFVSDLDEFFRRGGADAPAQRFFGDEFGMRLLEFVIATAQGVIFSVRNGGASSR